MKYSNEMTVLMFAYNEIEYVKLSVESLRLFCDMDVSLVIVDNGSTDGLQDWAREQTDLTYVFLDEGHMGHGEAINLVRSKMAIDTDLLIMEGHYMLTPRHLSRLVELLYAEEDIAAVSGIICNGKDNLEILTDIQDYKTAIELADTEERAEGKYALTTRNSVALWKKGVLDAVGEFEENVKSMHAVIKDYCMRVITADKKIMICLNAYLWCLSADSQMDTLDIDYPGLLEKKWGMHYFNDRYNVKLIELMEKVREESFSVLEIGCDCGATLLEIKNRFPNAEVYGSEINKAAVAIASHVASVALNDIEEENIPFPKKKFDYIIFGDVLEHLHNPLKTLIYCKDFLCKGGCIIASIPNVMHISIMEQLMQGDFTYQETGLLDKTHIHLFTYNEIIRMFHTAGYEICSMNGIEQLFKYYDSVVKRSAETSK